MKSEIIIPRQCLLYPKALENFIFRPDIIDWQSQEIHIYGRKIFQPRLTYLMGDKGVQYNYSQTLFEANPWNQNLKQLKLKIEELWNLKFNSALLNNYRNGKDYMGWHRDDEKELGIKPVVMSISFGASRDFKLKSRVNPQEQYQIELNHGDVLIMQGACQENYLHCLPKRMKVKKPRYNLSFRNILF
jgi:alkylated DNA repair dioxygenase AlkB